ncbi:MAG TPA: 1-acyl-sn-glycerol-3-phosphate acyltransferase [Gemmatimonadaceae bacterium]|nr:1-acyl-sn-glycerol-3-phosphate acyltransferase [Gemmatimonadaceae bacterium]
MWSWIPAAAILALLLLSLALFGRRAIRRMANRTAARALRRFRARVNRFKLTRKPSIKRALLADGAIADAVRAHAIEHGRSDEEVWKRVEQYVDEIVPFFNIIAYYKIGYAVSKFLIDLFYKVSVEYSKPESFAKLRKDAAVIYLMNHRSNADYVLVGYALTGKVAISYAVGEWARTWPLEYIFKSFGSYFIRRRYREPLYHRVLERYVQLITRNGVTQGIFLEGGLTRDGKMRPAKVGLLDYILGVARDPGYRERLHVVPVAVNYDRVLEDRSLLRELDATQGYRRPSLLAQAREVVHYVVWNVGRLVSRRWKRYGRAAVVIGEPYCLADWFTAQELVGPSLFDLSRHDRLARVQELADEVLVRIGQIIPVTPVPLACAAVQSFDRDFIPRSALLARMSEMRDVLLELNGRVLKADRGIDETFERAYRMLRMRRVLAHSGDGYVVLPHGRQLISYYANSIAHLLGPFEAGVRARDALPALSALGVNPLGRR